MEKLFDMSMKVSGEVNTHLAHTGPSSALQLSLLWLKKIFMASLKSPDESNRADDDCRIRIWIIRYRYKSLKQQLRVDADFFSNFYFTFRTQWHSLMCSLETIFDYILSFHFLYDFLTNRFCIITINVSSATAPVSMFLKLGSSVNGL